MVLWCEQTCEKSLTVSPVKSYWRTHSRTIFYYEYYGQHWSRIFLKVNQIHWFTYVPAYVFIQYFNISRNFSDLVKAREYFNSSAKRKLSLRFQQLCWSCASNFPKYKLPKLFLLSVQINLTEITNREMMIGQGALVNKRSQTVIEWYKKKLPSHHLSRSPGSGWNKI